MDVETCDKVGSRRERLLVRQQGITGARFGALLLQPVCPEKQRTYHIQCEDNSPKPQEQLRRAGLRLLAAGEAPVGKTELLYAVVLHQQPAANEKSGTQRHPDMAVAQHSSEETTSCWLHA